MKVNWYTSYYQRMATRAKTGFDIYIQVSRSIVCYAKDLNGDAITKLIDVDLGELLGNYSESLEDYYKDLKQFENDILDFVAEINKSTDGLSKELETDMIKEYGKTFDEMTDEEYAAVIKDGSLTDNEKELFGQKENFCINVFLLCHENLESQYSKKDEEIGKGKKGDYKVCHRRVLAKWLKDNLNMDIPEWNISKENESIVYRPYF